MEQLTRLPDALIPPRHYAENVCCFLTAIPSMKRGHAFNTVVTNRVKYNFQSYEYQNTAIYHADRSYFLLGIIWLGAVEKCVVEARVQEKRKSSHNELPVCFD
ncbi:MAG: hypothetical protein Q9202_005475 [Teloschistes flavicans]